MNHPRYLLDGHRRGIVLETIISVCEYRDWHLLAAHVRTNHIHAVIDAGCPATNIAQDFKEYASRALNKMMIDRPGQKRWARGFSSRTIRTRESINRAVHYVVAEQGEPLAVYSDNECPC